MASGLAGVEAMVMARVKSLGRVDRENEKNGKESQRKTRPSNTREPVKKMAPGRRCGSLG